MVMVVVGMSGGGREEGAEMRAEGIYIPRRVNSDIVRDRQDAEARVRKAADDGKHEDTAGSDGDRLQDHEHTTFRSLHRLSIPHLFGRYFHSIAAIRPQKRQLESLRTFLKVIRMKPLCKVTV